MSDDIYIEVLGHRFYYYDPDYSDKINAINHRNNILYYHPDKRGKSNLPKELLHVLFIKIRELYKRYRTISKWKLDQLHKEFETILKQGVQKQLIDLEFKQYYEMGLNDIKKAQNQLNYSKKIPKGDDKAKKTRSDHNIYQLDLLHKLKFELIDMECDVGDEYKKNLDLLIESIVCRKM
eukprot:Pgem_evm3s15623